MRHKYIVKLKWRNGEEEYHTLARVIAEDINKATKKVNSYLSRIWSSTYKDGDCYYSGKGYPCVSIDNIKVYEGLDELESEIGLIY